MKRADGRKYTSPRRQEQARDTRQRLLDSAYRLFSSQGYAATSIPAIAQEAGVAVPTVYWAFGSKRAILMELVSHAAAGDDEPVPLAERPWWQEMLAEPDAVRQLERFAAINRRLHERMAGAFEILRGAATSDPEIAVLQQEGSERRRKDSESVARSLASRGALREGVTEGQAADLLWTMSASDWYRMLVTEGGWSPEQYEAWQVSSLTSYLLPEHQRPD